MRDFVGIAFTLCGVLGVGSSGTGGNQKDTQRPGHGRATRAFPGDRAAHVLRSGSSSSIMAP